jgi:hypothetical protein
MYYYKTVLPRKYRKQPHHKKKVWTEKELIDKDWRDRNKKYKPHLHHNVCACWWKSNRKRWWKTLSNQIHRRKTKQKIDNEQYDDLPTLFKCAEFFDRWSID